MDANGGRRREQLDRWMTRLAVVLNIAVLAAFGAALVDSVATLCRLI